MNINKISNNVDIDSSEDDYNEIHDYLDENALMIIRIEQDTEFTTLEAISEEAVNIFFDSMYSIDCPMSPKEVRESILKIMGELCDDYNKKIFGKEGKEKINKPKTLSPNQIASIMIRKDFVIRIMPDETGSDKDKDLLAIYCTEGEYRGLYETSESEFTKKIYEYSSLIKKSDVASVMSILHSTAPRFARTTDPDLVAVNNGIFNYATKELMEFDSDFVITVKSGVDYNPNAQNITIHNDEDGTDWDVESWMNELSDDPEIVELLWEILSAIVRPFVPWNKSAWFYSTMGNNGKGTLCELMRQLVGKNSYASVTLEDFGKDFELAKIINTLAIITDENNVGTFIDKVANLKAIITGDVISINRKHQPIVNYAFKGFVVQCLNEMPRVKDKSESFYRRQLFIPFDKCFTGKERKYIKNDYLHRKEVLEYVLYKVLNTNFYELSEPAACRQALEEYKEYNDPVRQFMNEMSNLFVWDLLPFAFLYDCYKAWYERNNPGGCREGKQKFISELLSILNDFPEWKCEDKHKTIRPAHRMDKPEHLIGEYNLVEWKDKTYSGPDWNIICKPNLKNNYTGLLRVGCSADDTEDMNT